MVANPIGSEVTQNYLSRVHKDSKWGTVLICMNQILVFLCFLKDAPSAYSETIHKLCHSLCAISVLKPEPWSFSLWIYMALVTEHNFILLN